MYLREWQGVILGDLPAARTLGDTCVSAEFYGQLSAALKERTHRDEAWIRAKQDFGRQLNERFFCPYSERTGQPARILALGVGEAWAESAWADAGHALTFHDGHETYLAGLRERYPAASFAVGDLHTFEPATQVDFITMLATDFVMQRAELGALLRRLAPHLAPGGAVLIFCPNVLNLRRIAVDFVRRMLGRFRKGAWVFWGYWRSPGEFAHAASDTGLRLTHSLRFTPAGLAEARALWRLLPLRESLGLFVLTHSAA